MGETLALVGESGSGKSTLARLALGLLRPDGGRVSLQGADLGAISRREWRSLRRSIQPVFQDPASAFNPRKTALHALAQALRAADVPPPWLRPAAIELLERVGLAPGESFLRRFPHELSGGQRQRLAIARAMALRLQLIVADEPVSSLDVSVRGHVMNLLLDLQAQRGVAYLFITHGLALVRAFAHRVAVMHRGRIVEQGVAADVLARTAHPYTRLLLAAAPAVNPDRVGEQPLARLAPVHRDPPAAGGCAFYDRCPIAVERCRSEDPRLREVAGGHAVACHLGG